METGATKNFNGRVVSKIKYWDSSGSTTGSASAGLTNKDGLCCATWLCTICTQVPTHPGDKPSMRFLSHKSFPGQALSRTYALHLPSDGCLPIKAFRNIRHVHRNYFLQLLSIPKTSCRKKLSFTCEVCWRNQEKIGMTKNIKWFRCQILVLFYSLQYDKRNQLSISLGLRKLLLVATYCKTISAKEQ